MNLFEFLGIDIVDLDYVNRLFRLCEFSIKSVSALGSEMFRLTNNTRGGLFLLLMFFYFAFVFGAVFYVETTNSEDYSNCSSVGDCMYTMMRLTFFDGTGLDFARSLADQGHQNLFFLSMVYMCVTAFGLLNGLIGIFGGVFVRASRESLQKKLTDDDDDESLSAEDESDDKKKRPISLQKLSQQLKVAKPNVTSTSVDAFQDEMFSSAPPPSGQNSLTYSLSQEVITQVDIDAELPSSTSGDNHYHAVNDIDEEKLNHQDEEKQEQKESAKDVDHLPQRIGRVNATELELVKQELREMRESISSLLTTFLERCDTLQTKLDSL